MVDVFDGEVLNLDFTGVEEVGPIPPGLYPARVNDVDVHNSESSGMPCMYLSCELLGPEKYAGRNVQYIISLSEKSKGFAKRDLKALGVPENQLVGRLKLRPRDLEGRTCVLRIINENGDDGEVRYRARRVFPSTHATDSMVSQAVEAPFEAGGDDDDFSFAEGEDGDDTVF